MAPPTPEAIVKALVRVRQRDRFEPADLAKLETVTEIPAVVAAAGGPSSSLAQRGIAAAKLIRHYVDEVIVDRIDSLVAAFALTIDERAQQKNVTERLDTLHTTHGIGQDAYKGRVQRVLLSLAMWLVELEDSEASRIARRGRLAQPLTRGALSDRIAEHDALAEMELRPRRRRREPAFNDLRPYYELIASDLAAIVDAAEVWFAHATLANGAEESSDHLIAALWHTGLLQLDTARLTQKYGHRWKFVGDGERFQAHLARLHVRLGSDWVGLWLHDVCDGEDVASLLTFAETVRTGPNGGLCRERWGELARRCECDLTDPDTGRCLPDQWMWDGSVCAFHEALASARDCIDLLATCAVAALPSIDVVALIEAFQ